MSELAVLLPISVLYQLPFFFGGGGGVISYLVLYIAALCLSVCLSLLVSHYYRGALSVTTATSPPSALTACLSVCLYVGVPAETKSCVPSLNKGL